MAGRVVVSDGDDTIGGSVNGAGSGVGGALAGESFGDSISWMASKCCSGFALLRLTMLRRLIMRPGINAETRLKLERPLAGRSGERPLSARRRELSLSDQSGEMPLSRLSSGKRLPIDQSPLPYNGIG